MCEQCVPGTLSSSRAWERGQQRILTEEHHASLYDSKTSMDYQYTMEVYAFMHFQKDMTLGCSVVALLLVVNH